jgi:transposase
VLKTGELYRDLGGDYFRRRDPERQTKRLIAQLERLGHKVTLEAVPQAADRKRPAPQTRFKEVIEPR